MKKEQALSPRPRYRSLALAAVLGAVTVITAGSGERAAADGPEPLSTLSAGADASARETVPDVYDWLDGTAPASAEFTDTVGQTDQPVSPVAQEEPAEQVAPAPAPVVTPVRNTAPEPVRVAPPAAPAVVAPAPATCAANWFCYPRLGIAGPIVPYTDCSGSTDVGTGIRSYSCLSNNYLMGHAYTQFGLVRQWAAGDIVFAWGQRFTVTGAVTQQSCAAPTFPLATLSMQTSLTSSACGAVLVVQAR